MSDGVLDRLHLHIKFRILDMIIVIFAHFQKALNMLDGVLDRILGENT